MNKPTFTQRLLPVIEEEINRVTALAATAVTRFLVNLTISILQGIEYAFTWVKDWIDAEAFPKREVAVAA